MRTPFYYLSKYRSELMGLAILWVLWYHAGIAGANDAAEAARTGVGQIIFFFREAGFGGVDIFLLLSGIGIFCSLQKNSIGTFYINRIRKIVPTVWFFILIEIILGWCSLIRKMNIVQILKFATFTDYWLVPENQGNWYLYAITLFYAVSPLLYRLLCKSGLRKSICVFLLLAAFGISCCFFGSPKLMVFSRLPVYVLGFLIAHFQESWELTRRKWILLAGCCVAGFGLLYLVTGRLNELLWNYGLWWYVFFLIAPSLSLLLCGLMQWTEKKTGLLRRGLRILGNGSLEILLTSDILFFKWAGIPQSVAFIGSIAAGLGIHILIESIKKAIAHRAF